MTSQDFCDFLQMWADDGEGDGTRPATQEDINRFFG